MDSESVRTLRSQLRSLQRRIRQEGLSTEGISRTAVEVFAAIERDPGLSPKNVAEELQMTSSNVAATLRELEGLEYVRNTKDEADARRTHLFPTKSGLKAVKALRDERTTWLGRAMDELLNETERRQLFAAGRLIERLSTFEENKRA